MTTRLPVGTRVLHWGQVWARGLPGGTGEVIRVEGPDRHGDYEYLVRTGHDLSMPPSVDNPEVDERWWSSRHTRPAAHVADDGQPDRAAVTADGWPTAAASIAARWEHGHDQFTDGCALCTAEYNQVRAWLDRHPITDKGTP